MDDGAKHFATIHRFEAERYVYIFVFSFARASLFVNKYVNHVSLVFLSNRCGVKLVARAYVMVDFDNIFLYYNL